MELIAENLNCASPSVHQALRAGDRGWIESRARRLAAAGVEAIDVCAAGMLGAEEDVLRWASEIVETAVDLSLSLDSPHPQVLARVGAGRRRPAVLNSVACDALEQPGARPLLTLVRDRGFRLVVQLRRGAQLPRHRSDREAWTGEVVQHWARLGLPSTGLLVDPVLLPWGSDLRAGTDLLHFLEHAAERWPWLVTIVGLSNVSYQHPDRQDLHRRWLPLLRAAGLSAVILDAFDAELVQLARN